MVGVYDGSGVKLYINGLAKELDGQEAITRTGPISYPSASHDTRLIIGAGHDSDQGEEGARRHDGLIKEVKIYDHAVAENDISKIFDLDYDSICFLGNAKVKTDQGLIRFDTLTLYNTINNNKIEKITKVKNAADHMIFIRKHSLGKKIPDKNTFVSINHGIYIDNKIIDKYNINPVRHHTICNIPSKSMVRARDLVKLKNITSIKRNKPDTIYNILLEKNGVMLVNNIISETLNPQDYMVKKYI